MARSENWQPPQLEGRDDVVEAHVVDEQRDDLLRRLDTFVFSLESGELGNDAVRALDELEQMTRLDDPDARRRYIDELSVHGTRRLLSHMRRGADEHERRASLLSRFSADIATHLHQSGEGDDPAMLPKPTYADPSPAVRAR